MAVGDVYRLSVQFEREVSADDAVNVFHFRQGSGTIFDTPGEDLVEAFIDQIQPTYVAIVSSAYDLVRYAVRQVTGGLEVYEQGTLVDCTRGTDETQLPAQSTCVISWRSGLAGRSRRGRTYLPPTAEGDIVSGVFDTAYLDGVEAMAGDIIAMAQSGGVSYGNWEFGIWSETLGTFTPVTFALVRSVPATQRRRRLGVGS